MSLPKPTVRELLGLVVGLLEEESPEVDVPRLLLLRASLEASLTPKRAARLRRKQVAAKRAVRREVGNALRARVVKRAEGRCESCGSGAPGLEVDHFFGGSGRRRALEGMETCWALCHACHRAKTDNRPYAAFWLREFVHHAQKHGYGEAWQMALKRLSALEVQGRAEG